MSVHQCVNRRGRRIGAGLALALLAITLAACGGAQNTEEPTPTLTPVPSDTPLPTETPEPTPEPTAEPPPEPEVARVRITTTTNVRSGPSPDCQIIGVYAADTEVEVRAHTPRRDWWRVPFESTEGWVFAQNTVPLTDMSTVPEEPEQGCAAASGGGAGATTPPPGAGTPTVTLLPTLPTIGPVETYMSPTYDPGDVPGLPDCIANPASCLTVFPLP